jgi:DNA-binding MarR family transcriptional regulator
MVAESLAAAGSSTVRALASATGLGESTVARTLAALEAGGAASRTPGGRTRGRRLPDQWSSADPAAPATARRAAPTANDSTPRLRSGQLRERVLARLSAEADPVGPSRLARALGASSGAVGNALDRLVEQGLAERVGDRPRRYRAAGR